MDLCLMLNIYVVGWYLPSITINLRKKIQSTNVVKITIKSFNLLYVPVLGKQFSKLQLYWRTRISKS